MDLKDRAVIVAGCGPETIARRVAEECAKAQVKVLDASGVSCNRLDKPYRFERFEASIKVAPLFFDEPKSKYHK